LAQLAVTSISQTFTLSPGELCVQVEVDGLFDCLGWDVPCLVTDGSLCATTTIVDNCVKVTCDDWAFQVNMPAPCSVTLEEPIRGNRHALYRIARFEGLRNGFRARLSLIRMKSHIIDKDD